MLLLLVWKQLAFGQSTKKIYRSHNFDSDIEACKKTQLHRFYKQGSFITRVLSAALAAARLISCTGTAIWRIVLNYCSFIYAQTANGKESWKMIQDSRKQPEIGMKAMANSLPPPLPTHKV